MAESNVNLEVYGITEEDLEKSKDINPTLNLGKFEEGAMLDLTILDKEPKFVKHKNKFKQSAKDSDEKETPVLNVVLHTVYRPQEDKTFLNVPMNDEKYSLWLSSKSLSLGLARIAKETLGNLENIKVRIKISLTDYKEFGTNRCYNVTTIN